MVFELRKLKIWTSLAKYNSGSKENSDVHFVGDSNIHVVKESGDGSFSNNGNNFVTYYRKYTDNFCIQRGVCKITKNNTIRIKTPVAFNGRTNYFVFTSVVATTKDGKYSLNVYREDGSHFSVYSNSTSIQFSWVALGYTQS